MSEWILSKISDDEYRVRRDNNDGAGCLFYAFIIGSIVSAVIAFIKENWVTIVSIFGVIIVCVISCYIIYCKSQTNTGKKIAIPIILAIITIFLIIYIPIHNENKYDDDSTHYSTTSEIYGYVNTDGLNMRSSPNSNSKILKTLSYNTKIKLLDTTNTWFYIEYNGITGYVNSNYITY